jgi:potassium efflux system protein
MGARHYQGRALHISGESVSRTTNLIALWLRPFAAAIVACVLLLGTNVQAQNKQQPQQGSGVLAEQQSILDGLTAQVDQADKDIVANSDDDLRLVEIRLDLEEILTKALVSGVAFRPRVAEINARLEQIGPPPAKDEPSESQRVARERQALTTEKAEINVTLGRAEDLSVRINGLINKISMLRRDLFTDLLTKRYELTDAIGNQVISDVLAEGQTLRQRIAAALRFAFKFKFSAVMTATFLALLVALVVHFISKRVFGRFITRDPAIEQPPYIDRLSVAFWSTLLPSLALLVCFATAVWLYDTYGVLSGDVLIFLAGVLGVIWLGTLINRLGNAVLSPRQPRWRLIRIEPGPARILTWLMTALAVIVGLDGLAGLISDRLGSPLSVTIVKSLFGAILSSLMILTIAQVRPFVDQSGGSRPWPTWFRIILYMLGVGSILAAVAGYLSFAQFVSKQIVLTGAMVTTAYIGLLASRAISEEGGFAKTSFGRWLKNDRSVEDTHLDQLGVLASVVINILIVIAFLPFVLFQWGFQPGDIATWLNRAASGFQIGTFSFSPFAIVTGVLVFVAGYFLTRWFQRWLDGTVMARGKVEPGVRNSIRTVVGYAGLALAALVAISSAGLDLSNFALIAGGLSLGIGFGLQNIVSNFVSGLILLAERPLKVGDWVEAGTVSGTVKKISVRATEIETFQRQTVIVPNSVFINGPVGNWTHRNKLGRIEVPVGVVFGSDAKKVYDILLGIVRSHPMVLKNPEPAVLFTGFTDIAMTFEARGFLADINNGANVRNDIRFAMLDAFRENGIQLAFTLKPDPPVETEGWPLPGAEGDGDLDDDLPKGEQKASNNKPAQRKLS